MDANLIVEIFKGLMMRSPDAVLKATIETAMFQVVALYVNATTESTDLAYKAASLVPIEFEFNDAL